MALFLFGLAFGPAAGTTADNGVQQKKVSALRQYYYGKSGEWLYESLPQLTLPPTRPIPQAERPFILHVNWEKQDKANQAGFPFRYPCAVDFTNNTPTVTALYAGYQVKYHLGGQKLFDRYFEKTRVSPYLSPSWKKAIFSQSDLMRDRAMVFYLAFDQDQVRCVYYPGKIQFKGGDRFHIEHWLPAVTAEEKSGKKTDYALIQNSQGLLSILNGTFDRIDNLVSWTGDPKSFRYAGFTYDGRPLLPLQPEMATCALYADGHVALGAYSRLPDRDQIRTCVQNRFMVIEDGKPGPDEFPNAFCSVYDNIARSYLFTDGHHRVGVIWTLYTPPCVLVPLALEMGIQDMMLLDIHSPISVSLADTRGADQFSSYWDYSKRSYDLVPNFNKLSAFQSTLTWLSRALHSQIQVDYPQEAFRNGDEDYFAIYAKGSPEADRVSQPLVENPQPTPTLGFDLLELTPLVPRK